MTNEEKQKHIDAFKYWCETNEECGVITIPKFVCDNIIEILDDAPTVEARPKGKWELFEKRPYINLYMCSNCGHIIESMPDRLAENFKGCYCGADMR